MSEKHIGKVIQMCIRDSITSFLQRQNAFAGGVDHRVHRGTLLPALCQRSAPVSYTHLDVYKRQVQHSVLSAGVTVEEGATVEDAVLMDGVVDVYKRQQGSRSGQDREKGRCQKDSRQDHEDRQG